MKPKHRALLFNFIGFAILFIAGRSLLVYLFSSDTILLAVLAAAIAMVLAPKFAAVKTPAGEKLMMQWVFIKGFREI